MQISRLPPFIASLDDKGEGSKPRNSVPKVMNGLRFLAICGFEFQGIDLTAKKCEISLAQPLKAAYPASPLMMIGLKTLSIADRELRERRYKNDTKHIAIQNFPEKRDYNSAEQNHS